MRARPLCTYALPFLALRVRLELAKAYWVKGDRATARHLLREIDGILLHQPFLVFWSSRSRSLIPYLQTHLTFSEIGIGCSYPAAPSRADQWMRRSRSARLHRLPPQPLTQGVVDTPGGTGQQGDQTPSPRGRHLSERARRHPPRRCHLADMHDEWQVSDRRYLSEGSMAQLKPTSNNETVAAISASD